MLPSKSPNQIHLGTFYPCDMKHLILPFLFCVFSSPSYCQDTLVMKNGKQWVGNQTSRTPQTLEFTTTKKGTKTFKAHKVDFIKHEGKRIHPFNCIQRFNGLSITFSTLKEDGLFLKYIPTQGKKEKKLKKEKAFSYITGGYEAVLFKPYISDFDTITVQNARSLMEGRQDARRYYKNPWTGLANFGIGFASGYFLNYWGVFIPAAYTGVYSAINPLKSKRKVRILGQRYITDEFYRYGFNSKAKITKLKWSAGGGLLGIISGVGFIEYLKSKEKE
jgi:hypothetical protein